MEFLLLIDGLDEGDWAQAGGVGFPHRNITQEAGELGSQKYRELKEDKNRAAAQAQAAKASASEAQERAEYLRLHAKFGGHPAGAGKA